MNWTETNNYLKGIINKSDNLHDPVRVASFDLDDTLIHRPKGKLAKDKWKLLNSAIMNKIASLVNDGYIIVIFSNQSGMSSGAKFDKVKWRKAMDDLVKILTSQIKDGKFYFAVYVAKTYDLFRKPNIGLWEQMKKDIKEEFSLDKVRISKNSFFVGDAAGRTSASPYKKKIYPSSNKGDFSDTDRKFALNIGIKFLTPEEFFMEDAPEMEYKLSGINRQKFIDEATDNNYEFVPRKQELIVLVGLPGAGKSEFVHKYILPAGYVHINQDTCKTKKKCLDMTNEALEKKKSVVIDNTNPDVLSRMQYTSLAQEHGYKHIRCIILNTDIEIAQHLNNVRHVYSKGKIPKISDIVYNIFKKNFVRPQKTEHFDVIETVNFVFDKEKLNDPLWKKIFMRESE